MLRNIYSSYVDAIGYEPAAREVWVRYTKTKERRLTVYMDVPPDIADRVVNAASVGEALHRLIRGNYEHRYEEEIE